MNCVIEEEHNAATPGARRVRGGRIARFAHLCAWLYAAAVVICWLVLRFGGDRWWWATAMLYAPRWGWGLPLAILAPTALFVRRMRPPVALAAVWFAWPLAGLCVGSLTRGALDDEQEQSVVRVLTCNVGLGEYDEQRLADLILETDPHVVTLQEGFSAERLRQMLGARWRIVSSPGILLATRLPIISRDVFTRSEASVWRTVAVDYRLDSIDGPFDFVAVHLYTPRKGLEAVKDTYWRGIGKMQSNLERRDRESADASRWVAEMPGPAIVAVYMNLPPECFFFRRDWSYYRDTFAAAGRGYGYTYGYTKSGTWYGIRIDHVLASPGWEVTRAWVGPHVGSDHRPLIAELRRTPGAANDMRDGLAGPEELVGARN